MARLLANLPVLKSGFLPIVVPQEDRYHYKLCLSDYQNTVEHSHHKGKCPNEFETSYAPDRPEIVYCEQCYQAEVI